MYLIENLYDISAKFSHVKSYQASTIGCIIDISKAVWNKKFSKYTMMIKIIDDSLNCEGQQNACLFKQAIIELRSDKIQDLSFVNKIGNFIYLHKFYFGLQNSLQLVGKYLGAYDCVYSIDCGELDQSDYFKIQKRFGNIVPQIQLQYISNRIVMLKQFIFYNFFKYFNPFLGIKIVNNLSTLKQNFKIILKIKDIFVNRKTLQIDPAQKLPKDDPPPSKKSKAPLPKLQQKIVFEHKLFMDDGNNNLFRVDLQDDCQLPFEVDMWLLIREVANINTNFQVMLGDSSNIVILPKIFDNTFKQLANYQVIHKKVNRINNQKGSVNSLTYVTIQDDKISSVKELFELQDKYRSVANKAAFMIPNMFFLKCCVVYSSGSLKLYHEQYQMMIHPQFLDEVSFQDKKQALKQKKIVYVYEGKLQVVDRSCNSKKQILTINLFTNEQKTTFFDNKLTDDLTQVIGCSYQIQRAKAVQKFIKYKLERMVECSSFENPAFLAIEPIKSDHLIYRLIYTKVL